MAYQMFSSTVKFCIYQGHILSCHGILSLCDTGGICTASLRPLFCSTHSPYFLLAHCPSGFLNSCLCFELLHCCVSHTHTHPHKTSVERDKKLQNSLSESSAYRLPSLPKLHQDSQLHKSQGTLRLSTHITPEHSCGRYTSQR